jgi:hypothetical protein
VLKFRLLEQSSNSQALYKSFEEREPITVLENLHGRIFGDVFVERDTDLPASLPALPAILCNKSQTAVRPAQTMGLLVYYYY